MSAVFGFSRIRREKRYGRRGNGDA